MLSFECYFLVVVLGPGRLITLHSSNPKFYLLHCIQELLSSCSSLNAISDEATWFEFGNLEYELYVPWLHRLITGTTKILSIYSILQLKVRSNSWQNLSLPRTLDDQMYYKGLQRYQPKFETVSFWLELSNALGIFLTCQALRVFAFQILILSWSDCTTYKLSVIS